MLSFKDYNLLEDGECCACPCADGPGMNCTSLGLNQGIPYGGDGKGVVPTPLFSRRRKKKRKKKHLLFRRRLGESNIAESLESLPIELLEKRWKVLFPGMKPLKHYASLTTDYTCDLCNGTGEYGFNSCPQCGGSGRDTYKEPEMKDIKNPQYNVNADIDGCTSLDKLELEKDLKSIGKKFEDFKNFLDANMWIICSRDEYFKRTGRISIRRSNVQTTATSDEAIKSMPFFHITHGNPHEIEMNGLRPRSANEKEDYPNRIYLISVYLKYLKMKETNPNVTQKEAEEATIEEMYKLGQALASVGATDMNDVARSMREQTFLKINKLPNYKVYIDPSYSEYGCYVTGVIPAKAIEVI